MHRVRYQQTCCPQIANDGLPLHSDGESFKAARDLLGPLRADFKLNQYRVRMVKFHVSGESLPTRQSATIPGGQAERTCRQLEGCSIQIIICSGEAASWATSRKTGSAGSISRPLATVIILYFVLYLVNIISYHYINRDRILVYNNK